MKLLRCDFGDGVPRPAVEHEGSIVDLTRTDLVDTTTEQATFGTVLAELAADGVGCLEAAVVDAAESASRSPSAVTIVEPVASSGRFFALGGVYTQHLRERGQSLSRVPSQWIVPDTAIVGPDDPIVIPNRVRESVMPAVEFCVVIGKRGRYIREHDAMDHVAG